MPWSLWVIVAAVLMLALPVLGAIGRSRRRAGRTWQPTGRATLVGKRAVVLEEIINDEGVGCITVEGEVWTARAFAPEQMIQSGTRVEIVDVKGATALVSA